MLRRVVIPFISGSHLVMPLELSIVGIHRKDRRDIEIVQMRIVSFPCRTSYDHGVPLPVPT